MQNVRFTAVCLAAFLTLVGCAYMAERGNSAANETTAPVNDTDFSVTDSANPERFPGDDRPEIYGTSVGENVPGDSSDTVSSVPYSTEYTIPAVGTDNVVTLSGSYTEKLHFDSDTVLVIDSDTAVSVGEGVKAIVCDGSLLIKGTGSLTIVSGDTCIKSKNNLVVESGTLNLTSSTGDGLRADETLRIKGGDISISAVEGIEATHIIIDGGSIDVKASDDGLNASAKSDTLYPLIVINNGVLTVDMGQGDTDAIDSNGALIVNGGTINITAQFAFDYDSTAEYNGGDITVNGSKVTSITNSMQGGPGGFAPGGGFGPDGKQGGRGRN